MNLSNMDVSTGSQGYRVCIGKDYPGPIKLPEVKEMVRQWTEEFGIPPKECVLSFRVINDRTIDQLHELGVTTVRSTGGILAWEVYLGPTHL